MNWSGAPNGIPTCHEALDDDGNEYSKNQFFLEWRAIGYGFAPFHRLEIEFSDGITRQSNIFETAGFDSKYNVTVRPDDLLVEPQFSMLPSFSVGAFGILACICALLGVGLIAGIVIFVARRSKKN